MNNNNVINVYSDHSQIVVQNGSSLTDKGSVMIYDILGKEIVNRDIEPNTVTRIDMNNEAQAIYYVKVITNNQTFTKKICINK